VEACAALRARLLEAGYTTERIEETLGSGRISFGAADLAVHERRLAAAEPFSAAVRLFLLGAELAAADADAAFDVDELLRLGWLEDSGDRVRATLKLVPHGDLLLASDRDDDVMGRDWVAGIHPPSVTLAKLTVRGPVARALDTATGNGVQSLLASRHAEAVVATDVNPRALAFARLNAALNDVENLELREGSYFEPVEGERFDLLTCNPPYVISPESRYAYRDSGLPGDTVSRAVVEQAPGLLEEGGFAHILVSWAHPAGDWWSPLEPWVEGRGCDAWLLYFGSDDPVTHASEWLKPVARDDPAAFAGRLDEWLDYLRGLGIEAVGHGAVILRRRSGGPNWTRRDRVSLERLEQASDHILRVFETQDYLDALGDDRRLLDATFALVEKHHLEQTRRPDEPAATVLSLDEGLGFRTALDAHTTDLVPLLDGMRPLRDVLAELAPGETERFESAALPAVRRLLELGFLEPR
jgi:methylase of polypeptide subunit release factors